ncbi:hypothetical protein APY04_2965 [Hyphomicrobium sulfonivorans]|uniref:Uncharacterized protein n=1 Tax=Hyphomicrobium sulfonivorans TaxID=121290 RepID=A0A109BAI1_HYPSL|nr:hypothetical protein APY04_2965 [Hyphomicrobium sulfonivorans]
MPIKTKSFGESGSDENLVNSRILEKPTAALSDNRMVVYDQNLHSTASFCDEIL